MACSKCGDKGCYCNFVDTASIVGGGDGSSASAKFFNVVVDPSADNLLSTTSYGLLVRFYGVDGNGTSVSGSGTQADPFKVDVVWSDLDLCDVTSQAVDTVGCPPCDGEIIYCKDGVTYKTSLGKLKGYSLL